MQGMVRVDRLHFRVKDDTSEEADLVGRKEVA